ncbi:MAG: F0F1 ATP synthase subunit epsilon [Ruminococcaceae bacterium]|nr:F0F1 ATP synthase subunit epsilon [Oscillospiraceae bacterium]
MKTFRLIISSPDGYLFDDEVVSVSLRGAEGDLAVMAGHIPFITSVKPCDCKIELNDGDLKIGHMQGGLLTVAKDSVTLLSGSFQW